ncbi:MAG TPA: hypothetical protein VMG12_07280 [Polyangiaceae bacterium]|nr:hypothetical protein [Polyangiaceae bacterium]
MNDSSTQWVSRSRASHVTLAIAYAASAAACSGYYPLGDVSRDDAALVGDDPSPGSQSGDANVGALLAPPDVTISSVEASPDTLVAAGDMDGDGYGDMAVTALDPTTGVSYVQVRYGGPRPLDPEAALAFERGGASLTITLETQILMVFAAGDVDGDGNSDLIVQPSQCQVTLPGDGAYLVYGGPRLQGTIPLLSVAARFVPPSLPSDSSDGYSCNGIPGAAGPGDMDGDGIDDLVLSSGAARPSSDTPLGSSGEGVYVFYGRRERFSGEIPFSDADAALQIADDIGLYPVGDVNGDGLADLLTTPPEYDYPPTKPGSYLLEGRAQRYAGTLDLAESTRLLAGARPIFMSGIADLDGDGIDDLLLDDPEYQRHLFYGAPAKFEASFDFAQADAVLLEDNVSRGCPAGDRDGDGDDELVDLFLVPGEHPVRQIDVAFASGSRERFAGDVFFPESEVIAQTPNGRFPLDPYRVLTYAIPAGDLDGDGAEDLFTTSMHLEPYDDATGAGFIPGGYQLHIHYGTPAHLAGDPR